MITAVASKRYRGAMSPRAFFVVRVVCAIAMAVTACFHVVQAIQGNPSVVRHWVFVGINLVLAALLVWKHRWAFVPTLVLTVQQLWSHGQLLSDSFLGTSSLDWVSLAVCLFFPTLATILFIERRDEAEAS
jgi:hypothetical protein